MGRLSETELLRAATAIATGDHPDITISREVVGAANDYLLYFLQEGLKELKEYIELKKTPAMKPLTPVNELRID